MPPKNNLSAEIKWLLSAKPCIPPTAPLVAYDPEAPLSSAAVTQPSSSLTDALLPYNAAPPALNRGITQPIPPIARPHTVDIHKLPSPQEGTTDMARLRATPASNKPRIMVVGLPSSNAQLASAKRGPGGCSSGVSMPERSATQRAQMQDIEAIDLTGMEMRQSPSKSHGRKRKSDEFEADLDHAKSPRSAKTIPASSPSTDYDGFANIDDMMAFVPESPPPPYSTTVAERRVAHVEEEEEEEDIDMDAVVQPAPRNRKRKSVSRALSDTSAPARKLGRSMRSPSPLKRTQGTRTKTPERRFENTVLDSEDDDLDCFDGFEFDVMPDATPQREKLSRADPFCPPSQMDLPIRSPSKPPDVPDRAQINRDSLVTPDATQSPKSVRQSPKELQHRPASTLPPANIPSASQLPKDEKIRIQEAIEAFLDSEGCRLKRHIESAITTWTKAKDTYLKHAEAGSSTPAHQEAIKRANTQKKALEQLLSLKTKHEDLTAKRQDLRKKIADDIDNCEFNVEDNQALEAYVKSLADLQVQMYYLLKDAGLAKYMDLSTDTVEQSYGGFVVKSTQVTPTSIDTKTADAPGPDHVSQTQYMRQTQISKPEVWTPNPRIRFAETRIVESTPPRLDWNRDPQGRSAATNNTGLFGDQKMRQLPETRRRDAPSDSRPQQRLIDISDDDDEDFGNAFDVDDVDFASGRMGAAPEAVDPAEDEFCDGDDDNLFDEVYNIENKPPGAYDWKGDRVDSRGVQPARQAPTEAPATKAQPRKAQAPPSPQKPLLYAPSMNHPWSRDVRDALLYQFRLRGFRPGQLEAVNTTLAGEHCFVLMPTGGGKSLCYQLPSVIKSGKTRGVTIVVSPLLSLMEDQVAACRDRFGMQAFLINGESTAEEKRLIMNGLSNPEPQDFIQVLYVTPEMLSKNQRMVDTLQRLHQRNRLARIVIDEAHCVSQWGHDFRPDYKALGDVTRQFSGVPIIALTATATQLVRTDVMANLGIRGCRLFSQSFNRPNLSYAVLPKPKNIVQNIADLIKSEFPRKCGIVYCLSRKSCETVAKKLTDLGISAYHYHAGMESAERSDVQRKWQANKYHVIVATVAFGMGIDKADVRFVMHHSLPKSLEGYYQETGRAGRDGKKSSCHLYYNYGDCKILKKMIDEGDGSREQKQRQHDMLRNVIQFCENKSDCRRAQVLSYFSESFKKEDCQGTCDNCTSGAIFEERDLSRYAQKAIELVRKVHESNVTVLQCVDAFRGAKSAKIKKADVGEVFGFGADLERGDVERVFNHLLEQRALQETSVSNKMGFATNYVHLGPRSREYASGNKLFSMQVRVTPRKNPVRRKEPKKTAVKVRPEYPSTNVSSPVKVKAKKNLKQYTYDLDDGEDYYSAAPHPVRGKNRVRDDGDLVVADNNDDEDDYNDDSDFAPVRDARPPPQRTQRKSRSAPITVDERLAGLSDLQKDVLSDFMKGSKSMIQKIKMDKGLGFAPFSDTILREMCLDLPRNTDEMRAIPRINPEMVSLYGKLFLKLIGNARALFTDMGCLPEPRHLVGRAPVDEDEYEDDEEERPADPNHRIEIDLCGESDDDQRPVPPEDESVVSMDDFEGDEDDDGMIHTSHHFNHQVNPDVEAFNRQFSQAEATKPNPRQRAPSTGHAAAPRAGSSKPPFKKKGGYRKRASGSFGKTSYGGVTKKAASKPPAARKSGSTKKVATSGAGSRRPGGGSGAAGGGGTVWSGIMAMPTY
ncbi:hypothetical protein BU23DRAFT_538037 [Bimuria novae-zelandiae CBS 107.79]|uniref:DNA 3'-5' helicase n=1 Tax=Bimuria novae-zelandiae CBS 107.79 TaxID=1447943 RepID=A0A6A5UZU1_9PLEO|nr:hypothetical protein BU23DRAFT_538037 [Bimuria novae-zelandiae CBS 107.79]